MLKIIPFIIVFILISCASKNEQNAILLNKTTNFKPLLWSDTLPYLGEPTRFDTSKIALITLDKITKRQQLGNKAAELDSSDLLNLEIVLSHVIHDKQLYEPDWPKKNNVNSFYKWYVPYTINNEKVVRVHGSCWVHDFQRYRHYFPIIQDGGKCQFDVTINLNAMTYYDFSQGSVA